MRTLDGNMHENSSQFALSLARRRLPSGVHRAQTHKSTRQSQDRRVFLFCADGDADWNSACRRTWSTNGVVCADRRKESGRDGVLHSVSSRVDRSLPRQRTTEARQDESALDAPVKKWENLLDWTTRTKVTHPSSYAGQVLAHNKRICGSVCPDDRSGHANLLPQSDSVSS